MPLDDLSGWTLLPPSARDTMPVRVFKTTDEAMAFFKTLRDIAGAQRRVQSPRDSGPRPSNCHAGMTLISERLAAVRRRSAIVPRP